MRKAKGWFNSNWDVLVFGAIPLVVLTFLVIGWLNQPKPANAFSQCPVLATAPDGHGGTNVTYDCGLKDEKGNTLTITIDQPTWP